MKTVKTVKRFTEADIFSAGKTDPSDRDIFFRFIQRNFNRLDFVGENQEERFWLTHIWCLVKLAAAVDSYLNWMEWPEGEAMLSRVKAGINRITITCPRLCHIVWEDFQAYGIDIDQEQESIPQKKPEKPIERQPILRSIPSATLPPKKKPCNCRDQ